MPYRVERSNNSIKDLKKIDPKASRLILVWVRDSLDGCENPRAVPNGKSLQGTKSGWRYRVGSYRVLAEMQDDALLIKVVRAGHHQGVYNNLWWIKYRMSTSKDPASLSCLNCLPSATQKKRPGERGALRAYKEGITVLFAPNCFKGESSANSRRGILGLLEFIIKVTIADGMYHKWMSCGGRNRPRTAEC